MSWTSLTPFKFLERYQTELVEHESLHCLAWAAISRSESAGESTGPTDHFFVPDEATESAVFAILNVNKMGLILSGMNNAQARKLMAFLDECRFEPDTVEGPLQVVESFLGHWTQYPHRSHAVLLNQGLYELRSVLATRRRDGQMVAGAREHIETLTHFLVGFMNDCFPQTAIDRNSLAQKAEQLVTRGKAFLWKNASGSLVSMASIVRESPNTSSISLVYTPPDERGKGYAGQLMETLSQSQLNTGKVACNLFTDLDNPTSNKVYLRIGYQQIMHMLRVKMNYPARSQEAP